MRSLILLADGTGNSSGTFTRTNVWRLYRALDLTPPASGQRQQIAYYHDGVGTDAFKPLMLLGGIFGWGLKRNVIDLYEFVCRTYQPGDEIFAFGFSRGAFTIRVLIGLITRYGLVRYSSEAELHHAATAIYRENRTNFQDRALVSSFRFLRRHTLRLWRRLLHVPGPPSNLLPVERIAFVGVWDTVAAYGMPIVELARGIDQWIWPLDMPNLALSTKVACARQALALDEARETFHPMPWDEIHERHLVEKGEVAPGRLQQVWFAGMHADIGGGYADDELAYVALDWMMEEAGPRAAASIGLALRYRPGVHQRIKDSIGISAPLHDSRAGLGSYYRYQPRKLSAFTNPPAANTRINQDPDLHGRGLLGTPLIHQSVVDRIQQGPDAYAPIGMPPNYFEVDAVTGQTMPARERSPAARAQWQERVWDDVWRRRWLYFMTVFASIFFAALPFMLPPITCEGPQCLITPVIGLLGVFLPSFAGPWIESYGQHSLAFLVMAAALLLLRLGGQVLQTRSQDQMHHLWQQSLTGQLSLPTASQQSRLSALRANRFYQQVFHRTKWAVSPFVFGIGLLFVSFLIVAVWPTNRILIAFGESKGWYCNNDELKESSSFVTKDPCTKTTAAVTAGQRYRLTLTVTKPWADDTIDTNPMGFGSERAPLLMRLFGTPLRRSLDDRWFQPVVRIVTSAGTAQSLPLEMRRFDGQDYPSYAAEFKAPLTGDLYIYVNDALIGWPHFGWDFYSNNHGEAAIAVEKLQSSPLKFEWRFEWPRAFTSGR